MDDKRIIEFVILYCKEELTAGDVLEVSAWLRENKANEIIFRKYLKRYRKGRQLAFCGELNTDRAWNTLRDRIHTSAFRRRKRYFSYSSYAALFVVLLSVSVYLYVRQDITPNEEKVAMVLPGSSKAMLELSNGKHIDLSRDTLSLMTEVNGVVIARDKEMGIRYLVDEENLETMHLINTITVPRGGEYYLQLSDGTHVWLNAESKLVYPVVFDSCSREVQLEGEAYFEVSKDERRPFVIRSRGSKVRVLGTCFNISAYEQQENVITTLVKGSVCVSNAQDSLVLRPGQQSLSAMEKIEVKEVDTRTYIAWKTGVFEFEKMPLRQITDQLGRWYDVEFVYVDLSLQDILFTGAAERHRDLDTLLGMISKLSKVRFIKKDKIITISK